MRQLEIKENNLKKSKEDSSNSNPSMTTNYNSDARFEAIFNSEDALKLFKPYDSNKDYRKSILKL